MSDTNDRMAASTRTVELVVAAIVFAFGAITTYASYKLGKGWGDSGPESGYFPFYVGAIICLSAVGIFITALMNKSLASESFVGRNALTLVLKVLIPTIVYVILVGLEADALGIDTEAKYVFGIYIASFLYIAFFMWWIGRYSILKILPVAVGVPFVFFLLFEKWFRIPLPKGLFEAALGLL